MLGFTAKELGAANAPTNKGLVWAALGLAFFSTVEVLEIFRVYLGLRSGVLLISTIDNWYVAWSKSPLGYALGLAMHAILIVASALVILASCLTIGQWFHHRGSHRNPPTNRSNR